MSKASVFIIIVSCLIVYSGFAFDAFYSRSVYDFESCMAYGIVSTSTKGECSDIDGNVFRLTVSENEIIQKPLQLIDASMIEGTATSSVE